MENSSGKLADYMISGFFLRGHFQAKKYLTIIHFILFSLTTFLVFTNTLPENYRLLMILPFMAGIVITICQLFWIVRAVRVTNSIRRLEILGKCETALREIEDTRKSNFDKIDVIFCSNFAYFFPNGFVLSYEDVSKLYIASGFNRTKFAHYPSRKNVLWAKLSGGNWLPLAYTLSILSHNPACIKPLQNYAKELKEHNPAIEITE